ncbi:MAG TPA: beta-galactosidase [Lachnospiraceae bacterium]|nr:beta-galactosidase [Lachnospiraceae bacterium]
MIVPKHYENLKIMHENTMPPRAYYIPASKDMGNLVRDREKSDRIQMLSGEWKFKYFKSIYDLQEQFYESSYLAEGFETVKVPGMWQSYGYDCHQYTNIRYPIPLDPPYVPQENPCGAYICNFSYHKSKDAPKAYLDFEGVDSCFYVWVNGQYAGYSQVSHATAEFDITDMLNEGENKLAVLVLKWCDGTYLEDQDKFRMSGIFRDVYLLKRPEKFLYDYFTTTAINEDSADIVLRASFAGGFAAADISIYDREGNKTANGIFEPLEGDKDYQYICKMKILNPVLWNPENPYLYTMVINSGSEVITDRIGIREIHISDNIVYVNNVPVKFRGVNRHDSDPVTGFVTSFGQIMKDLLMIKQHNFNAIRSSHYPNVPYFYQLCDELGFFVINEADNESHGTQTQYLKDAGWDNVKERWNERIADNPDFIPAVLDRIQLCVQRDKNRACIVIWSMGNECAYGCTFEEALKWTKGFDKTRLTHYESSIYRSSKKKYDYSDIDINGRMYPSFEEIQEYIDNKPDKPLLLVEYCHSMGNGPGDLEDYFHIIDDNDILCGGFVWEWCDHAIYKGKAENGRDIYYYGGDHGENIHDSNFCTDGLVYPDRTPHTGLLECKNVSRPARVVCFDHKTGVIYVHNYLDFTNLEDYLYIEYKLECDGRLLQSGSVKLEEPVPPHKDGKIYLNINIPETGKCYLRLIYYSKLNDICLGFDELPVANKDGRNQTAAILLEENCTCEDKLAVYEDDKYLIISSKYIHYVYNKLDGLFKEIIYKGKKVITKPVGINIWRAPTDNDIKIKEEWFAAHYDKSVTRAYMTEYKADAQGLSIHSVMSVAAESIQKILDIDAIWRISNSGTISVSMNVKKDAEFPVLPRFGLRFFLDNGMDNVEYYGIGPYESYIDKHMAGWHGLFNAAALDMHEDYIRPQENGSHTDCDYISVTGNDISIKAVSENPFSFNVSKYTQEELTQKRHNYELEESGCTVLCIDYKQNGIGSNSCGPVLSKEYKFDEEVFTFKIKLVFQ